MPYLTRIAVLGLFWLVTGASHGQGKPAVELFFKPPAAVSAKLSPSGQRLAISTPADEGGRVGVHVLDLQSSPPKGTPVAAFGDIDIGNFHWVDDEHLVFDVVDLQLGSGEDQRHGRGLFSVRHDGSQLRQLVVRQGKPFTTSRLIRVLPLAWNHALLQVPQGEGVPAGEVIVGEWLVEGNEFRSVRPLWLDVRSGRTRRYELERLPHGAMDWWFNERGEVRAVRTLDKAAGREALLWYQAPQDGKPESWLTLAETAFGELPFAPRWVGRGDQLFVEHRSGERGESLISAYDFGRGELAAKPLLQVPGFDFDGVLIGDSERLLGIRVDAETEQTIWLDAARKALQEQIDEALPGRVNRISCRRCASDDAVTLVRSYSDQHPGELLLHRKGQAPAWQRIKTLQPGIEPSQMARVDLHRIKARDGLELPVWLTVPEGAAKARPAVVLVHGGPWARGGYWHWQGLQQFLASRGYLVIEPEFRGSEGYGEKHLVAGFKQWGQAMQDDVADALRWAQQQGLASDKACIAGASYGGYSTLMGLIRDPELYRCGVAWVAVTDPLLYLQGDWLVRDDISSTSRRFLLPERVGDPERDREMLQANSPILQADKIRAPLMLAFGAEDLRVPLAHGHRLRDALRKLGRDPEWVVYEGEAHGWRLEKHRVDFARRIEAFLARHLSHR